MLALGIGQGSDYNADPMHVPVESPIRKRLLVPGDSYHGSDVFAQNGERWLALLRTANGYRTAMETLRIAPVQDPVVDAETERTGKSVAAGNGSVVLLLKGFDQLANRSIYTAFDGEITLTLTRGASVYFRGRKLELLALPSGKFDEFPPGKAVVIHRVNLRQGEKTAALPLVVTEYNHVRLLWAGDLDGDGKADFLFEDSGYNWGSYRMFLSSAARDGEAAGEVGQFYRSGC